MSTRTPPQNVAFDAFVVDRQDERLIGPAGPIRIGNKAFRVLLALIDNDGRLVTKDSLLSSVWDGTIVTEASLTSAVRELRRALGDTSRSPRFIESVYGRGYRFIAATRTASEIPKRQPAAAAPVSAASPPRPAWESEGRPPLVLVSAFRDDAVCDRHPYFGAELREEVLSGLARFREIQLVADNRPEEEAAQTHRAEGGYQLTATLLPDGEGIKVIARARRLADGRILWAESMSLADTGTAGGVEKIVRRIAGAALPALDEDLYIGLPQEPDAFYNRYLLAKRQSFAAQTFDEARAAADALEAIVAERPGFALAYPPLARLYNTDFAYTALGSSGGEERARALQLAKDGLAADRRNVHAYTVLGFCHLWHEERSQAGGCFEQALMLNPYNPVRLEECATGWMYLGDLGRARRFMNAAAGINPMPTDGFREDSARLLMLEGAYAAAIAELDVMVSGTIWADLYRSVCELRISHPEGTARLRRWRERVEKCWRPGLRPRDPDIMAWIRRHKPFTPEVGRDFYETVEEGLAAVRTLSAPIQDRAQWPVLS